MIAPQGNGVSRARPSTARGLRLMVRRNAWLFVIIPLLIIAGTAVFVSLATPIYDGIATIRIDKQRSSLAVLDALQELSSGSEIATEMLELKGRTLAENVVDQMDLHAEVARPRRVSRSTLFSQLNAERSAPAQQVLLTRRSQDEFELRAGSITRTIRVGERINLPGLTFTLAPFAANQDQIRLRVRSFPTAVKRFRDKLGVARPEREASMVTIRYESTDRPLAAAIPNQVAKQFIASRDSVRKTQARSTVVFLRDQIGALGRQLTEVESGLLSYRERQGVISPEIEGETRITKLADLQAERDITESERRSLAALMAEVESPGERQRGGYGRLIGFPSLLKNPAASELLRSRNEAEGRRAELLKRATELDPEVVIEAERIRQLDAQLAGLASTYLQGLTDQVRSADVVLARYAGELARIPAQEIGLARLRRQAKVSEEIYTTLQTRLKEAEIAEAVEDPSVRIVDPASFPIKPIAPNVPLSFTLALLLSLALSAGIAFMRENLDNSIRTRDELQELSAPAPVLGMVPRIASVPRVQSRSGLWPFTQRNGGSRTLPAPAILDTYDPVAEAYRTLRTNIAFMNSERISQVLVISSGLPGEGKSTCARHLAGTLALQGGRVCLIDADMRRGHLHETLGAIQEPGLSNVLIGAFAPADVLQVVDVGATVHFMSIGAIPPNPAELLASARFAKLIEELRHDFTAIVIDTPPLNLVTDAAIAGSRVDGVLLMARAGVTDRDAFRHALEQLQSVRARLVGVILNDVDARSEAYYGGRRAANYYAPLRRT